MRPHVTNGFTPQRTPPTILLKLYEIRMVFHEIKLVFVTFLSIRKAFGNSIYDLQFRFLNPSKLWEHIVWACGRQDHNTQLPCTLSSICIWLFLPSIAAFWQFQSAMKTLTASLDLKNQLIPGTKKVITETTKKVKSKNYMLANPVSKCEDNYSFHRRRGV